MRWQTTSRPTVNCSSFIINPSILHKVLAELVDAVRNSRIWEDCVIIINYDEKGARWDHVVPPVREDCWGTGVRVPTIVVSPFVRSTSSPLEFGVPVFSSLVSTRYLQKVLTEFGPELAPGWHFVDSRHVKVHVDGSNPAGRQASQAMGHTKGGLETTSYSSQILFYGLAAAVGSLRPLYDLQT
jgi:phosphoesterase family protein